MGAFYIILAILLWSSLGVVVRLSSGVPVHVLMFYSSVIAAALQGLVLMRRKKDYRAMIPGGKRLFPLFILGCISLINTFTFFYAYKNTTIANAILTHYIAPVAVAFLAPVFLKERITKSALLSIAVASIGLWVLLGLSPADAPAVIGAQSRHTIGIMSGLVSGLAYAVIIILVRMHARSFHPLVLSFFLNLIVSLLLIPFIRTFPLDALPYFLILGIVHSTAAPILYFMGMARVTAQRAAILGYIEPVGAIIFGMMFFREYPGTAAIAGGALIIISGYITLRSKEDGL